MLRAVSLVLISLGVVLFPAAPVAAHARVVETSPEDGATLGQPPAEVAVRFDKKAVTPEGDPLRVYAPNGERVDRGEAELREGGEVLAVGIAHEALPAGAYQVEYRVISGDTHLIAGHFTFHSRAATASGAAGAAARESASGAGPSSGLVDPCGRCGRLPHLAAAGAVGLGVIGGGRRAAARARGRMHQLWGPTASPGAARVTPAAAAAAVPVRGPTLPGARPPAPAMPTRPAAPARPTAPPPARAPVSSDRWASVVATAARVLADAEGWWPDGSAPSADGRAGVRPRPLRRPGAPNGRT